MYPAKWKNKLLNSVILQIINQLIVCETIYYSYKIFIWCKRRVNKTCKLWDEYTQYTTVPIEVEQFKWHIFE